MLFRSGGENIFVNIDPEDQCKSIFIEEAYESSFISTVAENTSNYSKSEIAGAEKARRLYSTLLFPSREHFTWMNQHLAKSPVTTRDIEIALDIWGKKDINKLKGGQVRVKAERVEGFKLAIPKGLLKFRHNVFLTADIVFVNGIPFFLTLSRKLDFTAVSHLSTRKISNVFKAFKSVYQFYRRRGFIITTVHADNEFAPLQELINDMPSGPTMNLAAANEHVPEIERRIRVVKERVRALRHSLPFQRIPALMTIHVVLHSAKMLTNFPTKAGVSAAVSPRELLTGERLDCHKHLRLQFGECCQVHKDTQPRNSQDRKSVV